MKKEILEVPMIILEEKEIKMEGVKENYYTVKNNGKVYNKKGQEIKPNTINTGYQVYRLYSGHPAPEKYKHVLAHRLVMQTFHPIDDMENMTVNHKDANKTNNREYNLEWASQAENNEHGIEFYKKYGSNIYNSAFTEEQLPIIVSELNKGTKYGEILNIIGVEDNDNNRDYIGNIKRGKTYKREIKDLGLELNNGSSTIES